MGVHLHVFLSFLQRERNFVFLSFLQRERNFVTLNNEALLNGSTLKGKNLLLEEQILSFKELTTFGKQQKRKVAELESQHQQP